MRFSFFVCLIILFNLTKASGQDADKMLLLDMNVQIEATEAVNDMYNFKFHKAEVTFKWIRHKYPKHPLPYFMLGLSEWWKIVPNINNTNYDDRFLAYMDTSIYFAEKLYDKNPDNYEASFFLAAAYGFKGRLYSERKAWRKATWAGKKSLDYLQKSKEGNDLSPEFMFGDALYNYYSVWIPENYKLLKPILMFFPKGDKQLGLTQLNEVSRYAFYTRTEAQNFLMSIYALSENDNRAALTMAEYLHETFPDNAYFHRFHARQLFYTGFYFKAEDECKDILRKIDEKMPGYEAVSGRYASFFLGQIYESARKYDDAKLNYTKAVEYSNELDAKQSGYYLYSLKNLAKIALMENKEDDARAYYKLIVKHAEKDHSTYKEAQEFLKGKKKKKK